MEGLRSVLDGCLVCCMGGALLGVVVGGTWGGDLFRIGGQIVGYSVEM